MMVVLLTIEQKNLLLGHKFDSHGYFNPVQDADGNWFISIEERDQCDIEWVKECPEVPYNPIITEL